MQIIIEKPSSSAASSATSSTYASAEILLFKPVFSAEKKEKTKRKRSK
jgi:hypothetical protein